MSKLHKLLSSGQDPSPKEKSQIPLNLSLSLVQEQLVTLSCGSTLDLSLEWILCTLSVPSASALSHLIACKLCSLSTPALSLCLLHTTSKVIVKLRSPPCSQLKIFHGFLFPSNKARSLCYVNTLPCIISYRFLCDSPGSLLLS